jgi:hypothetical protein
MADPGRCSRARNVVEMQHYAGANEIVVAQETRHQMTTGSDAITSAVSYVYDLRRSNTSYTGHGKPSVLDAFGRSSTEEGSTCARPVGASKMHAV